MKHLLLYTFLVKVYLHKKVNKKDNEYIIELVWVFLIQVLKVSWNLVIAVTKRIEQSDALGDGVFALVLIDAISIVWIII